jgi:polysaccharide deacetylase family protein (PEP-CTERM system associated)
MATVLPFPPLTGESTAVEVRASSLINALTIDVEDYFHVSGFESCVSRTDWDAYPSRIVGSTRRLLDLLGNAGVRATFFILGWIAEREPGLVRAIRDAGHELACHGFWHRLIYTQTRDEFRADLRAARVVIEDAAGVAVTAYRAPSFSVTRNSEWALDVLAEEGFTIDSSIYPVRHDRYGLPGTRLEPHALERPAGRLWEFPPPVCRVMGLPMPIGGGGYFRLYPEWLTHMGLRRINAEGRPFSFYLHPWELDPEQPRLNPGWSRAFRHYVNLRHTERRLVNLLAAFRFGTMTEALQRWHPEAFPGLRRSA